LWRDFGRHPLVGAWTYAAPDSFSTGY